MYFFGFSRGAYTACFLNELLDFVGLLGTDNEEMIPFIWEAFATWKFQKQHEIDERQTACGFLKIVRETLARPISRLKFLGLFDIVNSIPEFQIDKRRITSSARVIRHAVSIDERRVKFQPVLFQPSLSRKKTHAKHFQHSHEKREIGMQRDLAISTSASGVNDLAPIQSHQSVPPSLVITNSDTGDENQISPVMDSDSDDEDQYIEEVWFPGSHGDVGGGWMLENDEQYRLSHAPLVWMVGEAHRAGVEFDERKMKELQCIEEYEGGYEPLVRDTAVNREGPSQASADFHDALRSSSLSAIHDTLKFGHGRSKASVLSWWVLEYLPFGWMAMQPNGSWKLGHWPLHGGKERDVPADARLHVSAIRRMESDESYRPANLIMDDGIRSADRNPKQYSKEDWIVHRYAGDEAREIYVRRQTQI